MNKYRYLLLFFSIVWVSNIEAQTISLKGVVKDSSEQKSPLSKTLVIATRVRDSILLSFTRTNLQGEYALQNLPIDTFQLTFYHVSSDPHSLIVIGDVEHRQLLLNPIYLNARTKQLATVNVNAYKVPIYYKGDTLVYVADSFKVKQNAVVEDLLKKLPGINVKSNGKITAQGKEVSRIYVDGDEFFGSDLTIATKNLSSSAVENVQVYEQQVVSSGSETTEQVMNLTLKENAKKGYFGKVEAALGPKKFYEAEALYSKFREKEKVAFYSLSSNTPRSGFDWSESDKFSMGNQNTTVVNDNGDESYSYEESRTSNGIPQTHKGGVHYQNNFGKNKKSKYVIDYTLSNKEMISKSENRNQYLLDDTTYFSSEATTNNTLSTQHILKASIQFQIDSLTKFSYTPSITKKDETIGLKQLLGFESSQFELVRSNSISNSTQTNQLSYTHDFSLTKEYKTKKRISSIRGYVFFDTQKNEIELENENRFLLNTSNTFSQQQEKINQRQLNYTFIQASHFEPLMKRMKLGVRYQFKQGTTSTDNQTNDIKDGIIIGKNLEFSNKFNTSNYFQSISPAIIFNSKSFDFSIYPMVKMIGNSTLNLDNSVSSAQNTTQFVPFLSCNYKHPSNINLNFYFETDSKLPSIQQIRPLVDNTNPNIVLQGNPFLKPKNEHKIDLHIYKYSMLSQFYFSMSGTLNVKQNDFATSTVFDKLGRTFSKTINTNGNYTVSQNLICNIPTYKNHSFLISNNFNYSHFTNFIDSQKVETNLITSSPCIGYGLDTDSLSYGINYEVNLIGTKSTISRNSDQFVYSEVITATAKWRLPLKGFTIEASLSNTRNSKREDGYNLNFLIANLSLQKSFFSTENLAVKFEVFDLFNQNIATNRIVNQNIITDNKTSIISRYFLLRLTYKFNHTKTKENDY
jgi:hypothetical protein